MAEPAQRPRRVVMVDADNPLVEIQGEFVWVDEHERVLAEHRNAAYRDGYTAGFDAGASRMSLSHVVVSHRRRLGLLRSAALLFFCFLFLSFVIGLLTH